MSAVIKSGATTDELVVDPVSKAARVTLYSTDGKPVTKKQTGAYAVPLVLLPTVLSAGAVLFSLVNTGLKTVKISRINMTLNFAGTAAATRSIFEFIKFTGTAPTGGSDLTVIKRDSVNDASPSAAIARVTPAGATTTGTSFDTNALHSVSLPNQLAINTYHDLQLDNPIILNPGEGLAIRNGSAIVAGAGCAGGLFWTEE